LGDNRTANVLITITNNASVTWNWLEEYQLIVASAGNGTVQHNDDWIGRGSNAVATAIPNQYCTFDRWIGAPAGYESNNPVVISAYAPITLTATFKPADYTPMGTPVDWLSQYGLTAADDTVDTDGDGFLNWQEYVSDTNPTNSLSYLKPSQIQGNVQGVQLTQPDTSTNRLYDILSQAQLGIGEWNIVTNQVGNGSNLTFHLRYIHPSEMFRSNVRFKE
jgi:hypothetical protein